LDAVGRHVAAGMVAGHELNANETLNNILVELDGFSGNEQFIVMLHEPFLNVLDPCVVTSRSFWPVKF